MNTPIELMFYIISPGEENVKFGLDYWWQSKKLSDFGYKGIQFGLQLAYSCLQLVDFRFPVM
jgi:hypothetical protein